MSPVSIEACYVWNLEEFLLACSIRDPVMNSLVVRFGGRFLAIVFIIAALVILMAGKPDTVWVGLLSLGLGLSMLLAFSKFFRKRVLKRVFRKAGAHAEPDQKVAFVIDESRVRKMTAGTEMAWIWELIRQVDATDQGFLIHAAGLGHWLPYHAFRDEDDRDDFARLATRRSKLIRLRRAPVFDQSGT